MENQNVALMLWKYIMGFATEDERVEVERWLDGDPSNWNILEKAARIWHASLTRRRIASRDPYKAFGKVHRRIGRDRRRKLVTRIMTAASFVIGVVGLTVSAFYLSRSGIESQMIAMTTNPGMRSHMTLPDGTQVYLNAGSTLTYPSVYSKDERRVVLEGEAYFKVVHDEDRPFIVSAADDKVRVKVLGTEFNVSAYGRDSLIQTTLVNGSVMLEIEGKNGRIVMEPCEKVTYSLIDSRVYKERCCTEGVTSWTEGCFVFRDTPMPEVLRQLSHFYSVDFKVTDRHISGYTFTGVFEDASLSQILDYLKISSKIDYDIINNENHRIIVLD